MKEEFRCKGKKSQGKKYPFRWKSSATMYMQK